MNDNSQIYVNNNLFLGRLDEQDTFRDLLGKVLTEQDKNAPPRVILLYGEGGMGKSLLTRRLLDIARQEPPFERDFQTLLLDWEEARYKTLALKVPRDQIKPETMLQTLFNAIPDADKRHFKDYRRVIERRDEAEKQAGRAFYRLSGKFLWPGGSGDAIASEAGLQAARRATTLDAGHSAAWYYLGVASKNLNHYREAEAAYRRAIELDEKDALPHNNLGILHLLRGDPEAAAAAFQRAVDLEPENAAYQASLGGALRQLGREAEAEAALARARQGMDREDDYNKACIEALSGNAEAALEYLAQALSQASGKRDWAKQDPDLALLREDPRFMALLQTYS